jgi:hypothetical protein
MLKEEATLLEQLSISLSDTIEKIEKAYERKDANEFNNLRKFFFQIQEKITEISK